MPGFFDNQDERHHDVTRNEYGEIGWRVIGPLVMQFLATGSTPVGDLHEPVEHPSPAASRATAAKPPPHGLFPRTANRGLFRFNGNCHGSRYGVVQATAATGVPSRDRLTQF
jgi:hypothetical protein